MIQHVLLVIGAIVALHAVSATKQLRSNSKKNDAPLSVDVAIGSIADFLWNQEDRGPSAFVMKGSHATSPWAREHGSALKPPCDDIDVFVEAPASSEKCPSKSSFVTSRYVKGVFPCSDTKVQVTAVCTLDRDELVRRSDINVVSSRLFQRKRRMSSER